MSNTPTIMQLPKKAVECELLHQGFHVPYLRQEYDEYRQRQQEEEEDYFRQQEEEEEYFRQQEEDYHRHLEWEDDNLY
ncbi:hypothetical protein HOLleu_39605 [Holothuria leucospilota]|uniref:Uncharacterized protein n=1 Tax=Holothuria leucospilota TaxID=206669 RepID=A0A9Q1BC19_HOLLE|nr:hypothetical protein HOLleu_39605 [Holothuria leucospilota]